MNSEATMGGNVFFLQLSTTVYPACEPPQRTRHAEVRLWNAVRFAGLFGLLLLFALTAISMSAEENPSARDVLEKMAAAAEAAIPYSVEFNQNGALGTLKCLVYEQRSSAGHYQIRIDESAVLPGNKEYRITSWENEDGLWQQYNTSVLRLDFAPHTKQSPLMAFVGSLPNDNYDDVNVEKEITFQGTPCYVIRGRLHLQPAEADAKANASRPVEQLYTISKSDWLPRQLETFDSRGNKIGSMIYSNIQTHLSFKEEFIQPPITNALVVKSISEMTHYVQTFNHPFVPAAREVLSIRARTGKKIGTLLSAFVVLTGIIVVWRIRRSKIALGSQK